MESRKEERKIGLRRRDRRKEQKEEGEELERERGEEEGVYSSQ